MQLELFHVQGASLNVPFVHPPPLIVKFRGRRQPPQSHGSSKYAFETAYRVDFALARGLNSLIAVNNRAARGFNHRRMSR
jgi:hypothetical protein